MQLSVVKVSSRLVCLMAGGRGTPIRLTLHITGNEDQRPGVSTQQLSTGPGGVRNLKRLVSSHRSHPIDETDSC